MYKITNCFAIETHGRDCRWVIRGGGQIHQTLKANSGEKPIVMVSKKIYTSNKYSFFTKWIDEGKVFTLIATYYKESPTVFNPEEYIVRRITPLECCRLQGFPDTWCDDLETENPSDEELQFWRNVFDEKSEIEGKKKKTDTQIIKWLNNPRSDIEEYKMWGNGVALPCVDFILGNIAEWDRTQEEQIKVDTRYEQLTLF